MLPTLIFALAASGPDAASLHADALGRVRRGDVFGAAAVLERLRALAPGSAYLDLVDGHIALGAKDRRRAEQMYARAVARARATDGGDDNNGDGAVLAEGLHATGRLFRMEERWAEAAAAYDAARQLRPASAALAQEGGFVEAKAAFAEGRLEAAAALLRSALSVEGGDEAWGPTLHRELGHATGLFLFQVHTLRPTVGKHTSPRCGQSRR